MTHRLSIRRLTLGFCAVGLLNAEDVRLAVTADTSIASDPSETTLNYGGDNRIKLKGIENMILVGFDAAPLAGKIVDRAHLHLHATDARLMVRSIGMSTVATAWNEGSSAGTAAAAGEACFLSPAQTSATWAGPGSIFVDAVWGRGGTIHAQAYATSTPDGWYTLPIDGRILEACAHRLSYGICVSDDNGQTKAGHQDVVPDTNHGNNFFHAREQAATAPFITATCRPAPTMQTAQLAIAVAPWAGGADSTHGGLEIRWPGPLNAAERAAIIGYRLIQVAADGSSQELPRWMHPAVAEVGESSRALLRGQAAATSTTIEVSVIGRGGVVLARGSGNGKTSPALPAIAPLALPAAALPKAGPPPADERGLVFAMPELAKAHPVSGNVLEEPGVAYAGEPAGEWRNANPVWSGAERTVSLAALRGEWVGFQLVCCNRQPSVTWQITPSALRGPGTAAIAESAVRMSRLWYQKAGKGDRDWFADPLLDLPAGAAFTVPDARNAVPGQATQTVYVELFVPKDAAAGTYTGRLDVSTGAGAALPIAVRLDVAPALIPDEAAFTWSMNGYASPAQEYGEVGSEAFLAAERSFYRMAHEHRLNLAVLGYSHSGKIQTGVTWPLAGTGTTMKSADWTEWDKRYGPYFDGSAFAGTPRAGVPLDHFYLPLHENWPTTMADGYAWNDVPFEEHWKTAGPVAEGFSARYREQWIAVLRDFRQHAAEKKWRTSFQIYLNDKYFYKQYTPKTKARGQGTSFWLLDEPLHIDDFAALAWFGRITRAAQDGDRHTIAFRVDVSRPQWGRDTLDRITDVNVTGGFANFRPWLEDWRTRHGQRIWTYGGAPSSTASAYGIVMQGIDLYSRGVDGFVPWLTLGSAKHWQEFTDTTVFYTGKPMGLSGACASLRLKAYRRSEQDVEYLRLLSIQRGMQDPDRRDLAALIGGTLESKRTLGLLDGHGAVTESFSGLQPGDFERLRRAIAGQLGR